jgi:hypothetical protein
MEEATIRKAADQMVKLHGNGAEPAAALRAEAMLAQGNIEGFHAWNRITTIISGLARKPV